MVFCVCLPGIKENSVNCHGKVMEFYYQISVEPFVKHDDCSAHCYRDRHRNAISFSLCCFHSVGELFLNSHFSFFFVKKIPVIVEPIQP